MYFVQGFVTAKFLRKAGKCLQICVILRFGLSSRHVTPLYNRGSFDATERR